MNVECLKWIEDARKALGEFDTSQLDGVVRICAASLKSGGTLFFCGNGGSAADSMHLSAELVGRFLSDREPMRAMALTADNAAITAIANDFGYEGVFARQLSALARAGDTLIAISTSGRSPSILAAVAEARRLGLSVVAMTGAGGADLAEAADASVVVPASVSGHVQEVLLAAGHAVCAALESESSGRVS